MKAQREILNYIKRWELPPNAKLIPWIGVDLDSTLCQFNYQHWYTRGDSYFGEPIEGTVELINSYLSKGCKVKIFTARLYKNKKKNRKIIQDWLESIGLPRLEVTNEKDYAMVVLYDDRVKEMVPNEGRLRR